jgi:hypothetical protein
MTEKKYNEPGYTSPALEAHDRELRAWWARQPAKRRRDAWIDFSRIMVLPVALLLAYVIWLIANPPARHEREYYHANEYWEDE